MSEDLAQKLQELQAENEELRRALEQKTVVANKAIASYQQRALHMELIRQQNQDLDRLTADLSEATAQAEERAQREQTIRAIEGRMQSATSLSDLVRVTAEALNTHFSARYTLIELGVDTAESGADQRS